MDDTKPTEFDTYEFLIKRIHERTFDPDKPLDGIHLLIREAQAAGRDEAELAIEDFLFAVPNMGEISRPQRAFLGKIIDGLRERRRQRAEESSDGD